jgi:replicative DNA helicase
LIRLSEDVGNNCYAGRDSVDVILEDTEKRVFDLIHRSMSGDFVPIREIVVTVLDRIQQASENRGAVTGIATGFSDLDYRTAGLQPSELILLASRPSMGKTALALNIAHHVAFKLKQCIAIFSLEMSKEQLVNRLISMEARIDSHRLRTGSISDQEWSRLFEGAGVVGMSNLIIDDTPAITIRELRSKFRKYKLEHNLQMIVIDYLQMMSGSSSRYSDSRQNEISDISRALKALARELNVPVLVLPQLNRLVEQRPEKRPVLSDLRDSGAIEQDADVVMFIYRDEYYNRETEKKGIAEIHIAKQRNGPIGTIELIFIPELTRFANTAR